jgi:hypothetical protein
MNDIEDARKVLKELKAEIKTNPKIVEQRLIEAKILTKDGKLHSNYKGECS